MCKICPKCGSIAEYSSYYGRVICTNSKCTWESDSRTTSMNEKPLRFYRRTYTQKKDKVLVKM